MIILSYIFYSFAAVAIIYETMRFFGFNSLAVFNNLNAKFKEEQEYNKKIDAAKIGDDLYLKDKKVEATVGIGLFGCTLFIFTMTYWLWSLIGLTSSQWQSFLALIVLSLIYGLAQKAIGISNAGNLASQIALRIDATLSITILIFILINRFQLGWTI